MFLHTDTMTLKKEILHKTWVVSTSHWTRCTMTVQVSSAVAVCIGTKCIRQSVCTHYICTCTHYTLQQAHLVCLQFMSRVVQNRKNPRSIDQEDNGGTSWNTHPFMLCVQSSFKDSVGLGKQLLPQSYSQLFLESLNSTAQAASRLGICRVRGGGGE